MDRKQGRDRSAFAKERIMNVIDSMGFEYVGGYTNTKGSAVIRCKQCGHTVERTIVTIRKGKYKCRKCLRLEEEKRKAEERQAKIEQRMKQKAERKKPSGFSYYQIEREKKMDEVFTCAVCGKEYTPRQYMADANIKQYSNIGYCSVKCRRKAARKRRISNKSIRHRTKHYGCEYDPSVTLEKLIGRYGLRCGICGELCDPSDRGWTEYFGPASPTIDHIYPLAKGGGHTWDNVQVAHAMCNSVKKDDIEEMSINDAS